MCKETLKIILAIRKLFRCVFVVGLCLYFQCHARTAFAASPEGDAATVVEDDSLKNAFYRTKDHMTRAEVRAILGEPYFQTSPERLDGQWVYYNHPPSLGDQFKRCQKAEFEFSNQGKAWHRVITDCNFRDERIIIGHKRIREGMSEEDALSIMGENPFRIETSSKPLNAPRYTWHYALSSGVHSLTDKDWKYAIVIQNGKVISKKVAYGDAQTDAQLRAGAIAYAQIAGTALLTIGSFVVCTGVLIFFFYTRKNRPWWHFVACGSIPFICFGLFASVFVSQCTPESQKLRHQCERGNYDVCLRLGKEERQRGNTWQAEAYFRRACKGGKREACNARDLNDK